MHCDNTKTSSEIEHVDWSTGTGSGHHYANVRFGSGSSQASQSSGDICRICHCESDPQNPLLTPCYCAGSLKYVHQACLQQWLTASETNACELCKFPFIMHTKIKPFNEWRSLDISGIERRRLCCSVLFHCAAALCVIWSLCVLIERAADDVKRGLIDWPFWTKLAVVTVGLTGGVVFMYIQCKAYLHLCHRWKARNRILLIQNAPEKVHAMSPPSPAVQHRTHHEGSCEPHPSSINAPTAAGDGPNVEIVANGASASNGYNYAVTAGGNGSISGSLDIEGAATLHQHPLHHYHLPAEQRRLQQSGDTDSDVLPATHHHSHLPPQQQVGQVAVAANIECAQLQSNYERDWALDDVVSQISSFRPCPQGSGSMTPFHDSIHNVLEHSENSSRGSVNDVCGGSRQDLSTGGISTDTGREHALQLSSFSGSGDQKAPSISSGVSNAVANGLGGFAYKPHTKRYSNSSIFVENRDILNDSMGLSMESSVDYPATESYRHANTLTPPSAADVEAESEQLDKFLTKDLRRYSDTKLVIGPDSEPMLGAEVNDVLLPSAVPIEPVYSMRSTLPAGGNKRIRQLLKQNSATAADTILDMELPTSPLSPPAAYAVNVTMPTRQTQAALRRSLHTVDELGAGANAQDLLRSRAIPSTAATTSMGTSRRQSTSTPMFKSLPNLSGSCENLLRK